VRLGLLAHAWWPDHSALAPRHTTNDVSAAEGAHAEWYCRGPGLRAESPITPAARTSNITRRYTTPHCRSRYLCMVSKFDDVRRQVEELTAELAQLKGA